MFIIWSVKMVEGEQIGNYRIVRRLGEGGMGAVYEVLHQVIGRRAAIKVLRPEQAGPDAIERFLNEARAVNQIQHPNVIDIYDVGTLASGALYLVMELLQGSTLRDRLRWCGGRLGLITLSFARQIAAALHAAHRQGIVHRDLKPENVMIVGDPELPLGERIKLLDFGIAKVRREKEEVGLMGTPRYMAPEQCRDASLAGPPADVYALGIILYELLVGHPPFLGPLAHVLTQHLMSAPPPLRELDADLPPALTDLVHDMLAKDPEDRPTIAIVATILDRLCLSTPPAPRIEALRR